MEQAPSKFKKYIFVCENQKADGACCGLQGAQIREELKKRVKALGLDTEIRVSRSGCIDVCSEGPNVLLLPQNLWFKKVSSSDVEQILQKASSS